MQAFSGKSTFPRGEGYFWDRRNQLDKSEFPELNRYKTEDMSDLMETSCEALPFTEAELKELERARMLPITFDEDSPETTPERAIRFRRVNPPRRSTPNTPAI